MDLNSISNFIGNICLIPVYFEYLFQNWLSLIFQPKIIICSSVFIQKLFPILFFLIFFSYGFSWALKSRFFSPYIMLIEKLASNEKQESFCSIVSWKKNVSRYFLYPNNIKKVPLTVVYCFMKGIILVSTKLHLISLIIRYHFTLIELFYSYFIIDNASTCVSYRYKK